MLGGLIAAAIQVRAGPIQVYQHRSGYWVNCLVCPVTYGPETWAGHIISLSGQVSLGQAGF